METFLEAMLPSASPSSQKAPVATLAFIDLETTGLPFDVGKKNVQITELSIVAIDRTDFECDAFLRVANKLNIYVQPRTEVSLGAMNVTGLYNDLLERQKPFDSSIPEMLNLFFSRLRSPICLLAHNGKSFDFPLLQAELKRIGVSLPPLVVCADTLSAFRSIGLLDLNNVLPANVREDNDDAAPEQAESAIRNETTIPFTTDIDYDAMLNEDINIFKDIDSGTFCVEENVKHILLNGSLPPGHGEKTPNKACKKSSPISIKDKISKNNRHCGSFKQKLFTNINLRDVLNSSASPQKTNGNGKRVSYSLENIYRHYFGTAMPDGHQALSDCINLCKVCQKISTAFLPWIDEKQVLFSDIKAMW